VHILIDIYIKGKNQTGVCIVSGEELRDVNFIDYSGLSNNQCEWRSVVHAMGIISGMKYDKVAIHIDSKLVYYQVNFIRHIKNKQLKQIYFEWNRYKNILYKYNITYNYISGHLNPARKEI